MRSFPIRLRLTAGYSICFVSVAILLSCASWWMLRHASNAAIEQDLHERVDDIRAQLKEIGPQVSREEVSARLDSIYRRRDDGKWLQILDEDGHWVYRSPRMIALKAALASPHLLRPWGSFVEFKQGSRRVRASCSSILVGDRLYAVETGTAVNKQQALLQRFGLGLFLLTPAVLALAILTGHLMSGRALAPVVAIAREARHISSHNLNARLPISPAHDELAELSMTLNDMLARIDAGFRTVRDFTANASHELRTPLARLRTEVEVALLSRRSAEQYRDTLESLQLEAVEMTEVLESLLLLSRAETGYEVLRRKPVCLQDLVQSVYEEWLPITERHSIRLFKEQRGLGELDRDQAVTVLGDELALKRLLRIWMDNACKFTPTGGKITISLACADGNLILALEDSGIGIAPQYQARIFDRFFKVERDYNALRSGAGLGLSLASWIAEQHDTRIDLQSSPLRGSRFQIALTPTSRSATQNEDTRYKSL